MRYLYALSCLFVAPEKTTKHVEQARIIKTASSACFFLNHSVKYMLQNIQNTHPMATKIQYQYRYTNNMSL
jgi:hypothetical protein